MHVFSVFFCVYDYELLYNTHLECAKQGTTIGKSFNQQSTTNYNKKWKHTMKTSTRSWITCKANTKGPGPTKPFTHTAHEHKRHPSPGTRHLKRSHPAAIVTSTTHPTKKEGRRQPHHDGKSAQRKRTTALVRPLENTDQQNNTYVNEISSQNTAIIVTHCT